jgi:hypothetical protein
VANPWDIRERQPQGDKTPEGIFAAVGAALTTWEALESELAEVFDALVSGEKTERIGFATLMSVGSSHTRGEIILSAAERALALQVPLGKEVHELATEAGHYRARRNEIAHGRCFNLDKHGFYFAPNNIAKNKWKDGAARYQWVAADIHHYGTEFASLCERASHLAKQLRASETA